MSTESYSYIIVGGGLAGASAADGIRERDHDNKILIIGNEKHLPYNRPPLTKSLWFNRQKLEQIFVHDEQYYSLNHVDLLSGARAVSIDAGLQTVSLTDGRQYAYQKLLLATGGLPLRLRIPGGDLDGICYYRFLDDYSKCRAEAKSGTSAVVIGGGFIGSEIAAALSSNDVSVTMIFPDEYLLKRVFPGSLARAIQQDYINRGVVIRSGDKPAAFTRRGEKFITRTESGIEIESDMVIVGIGIAPSIELAERAGLATSNGISVNSRLATSNPNIFAAGDNACFPAPALYKTVRFEHWDNAKNQGAHAGKNMAGGTEPYTYLPYFFSDLFEFGYEAVGDVDARLDIFADWREENKTGVIYYLKDGKVRGVLLCNVWEQVDAARSLIENDEKVSADDLKGAIYE